MTNKWDRRENKKKSKKNFLSDNRKSIRLIKQLSLLPNKLKQLKRKKFK